MSGYGQGGGGYGGGGYPPGGGGYPPGGGGFGGAGGGGYGQPPGGGYGQPPGGGGGFGGQPPPQGGGGGLARIPFTPQDERMVAGMATFMVLSGVITILGAILGVVGSVIPVVRAEIGATEALVNIGCTFIGALVSALLGAWLIIGGGAFKKLATTDGADQAHLVAGFRKLRAVFLLKSALVMLLVLGFCIGLIAGMGIAAATLQR